MGLLIFGLIEQLPVSFKTLQLGWETYTLCLHYPLSYSLHQSNAPYGCRSTDVFYVPHLGHQRGKSISMLQNVEPTGRIWICKR